jgi:hypothetical protein
MEYYANIAAYRDTIGKEKTGFSVFEDMYDSHIGPFDNVDSNDNKLKYCVTSS